MGLRVPTCLSCDEPLPLGRHYQGQLLKCRCTEPHQLEFFPAALREDNHARMTPISDATDASCFRHPEAAAEAVCSNCGSYMCGLCATDSPEGNPVCLPCLDQLANKDQDSRWRREWTNWDTIALHLALIPFIAPFFYYFVPFSAPAAAILAIWKWNNPRKRLIPRSRIRIYAALGIAMVEMLAIGVMFFFLFTGTLKDV